jgi:hypothetical protein
LHDISGLMPQSKRCSLRMAETARPMRKRCPQRRTVN